MHLWALGLRQWGREYQMWCINIHCCFIWFKNLSINGTLWWYFSVFWLLRTDISLIGLYFGIESCNKTNNTSPFMLVILQINQNWKLYVFPCDSLLISCSNLWMMFSDWYRHLFAKMKSFYAIKNSEKILFEDLTFMLIFIIGLWKRSQNWLNSNHRCRFVFQLGENKFPETTTFWKEII